MNKTSEGNFNTGKTTQGDAENLCNFPPRYSSTPSRWWHQGRKI